MDAANGLKRRLVHDLMPCEAPDLECPICYTAFEPCTATPRRESVQARQTAEKVRSLFAPLRQQLTADYINFYDFSKAAQFRDPALFLPTNEYGDKYARFPQTSLATLAPLKLKEEYPSTRVFYADVEGEKSNEVHCAVKMAECSHVFGKLCIVEWLNTEASCPLCRNKVQWRRGLTRGFNSIPNAENLQFRFQDSEQAAHHQINQATSVMAVSILPMQPGVTLLVGDPIPQSMAHPFTNSLESMPNTMTTDPNLTLIKPMS